MSEDDHENATMQVDFLSHGKRAHKVTGWIIGTRTKPSPFLGCGTRAILPGKIETAQPDGS